MAYIEFKDVCKVYETGGQKVYALHNMRFTIERGEFCVIVGPSGAGKTTLLNILGGMDTVTSGNVTFDGKDIGSLTQNELTMHRRLNVGFVFQYYNLVQNLTARENVELASELSGSDVDADGILREVGLAGREDNFPAQLSGGEQQRVSIARAIAKNPQIVLCDEPTGALDTHTGTTVLKVLQDMCREKGKTVVVITHNSAITKMADRVIHIMNGETAGIEMNSEPVPVEKIEW
jgi:ABC-type antimicrobial peptide transport system, ATPase component